MIGDKKVKIRTGGDFNTAPADKYTVQIADVNPKTVFSKYSGAEEERLNFEYIILDDKPLPTGEGTTRGIRFWHLINPTLGKKSWLLKLAKAVLGRDLTDEEMNDNSPKFINPDNWVGKQVDVMVSEDPNQDNTAMFNNVVNYSKTARPLQPTDKVVSGQATVESETQPAVSSVETAQLPNLNPELDKFLGDLDSDEENKTEEKEEEVPEEESLEELEAKLKLAKAKAKKAKAEK